MTEKLAAAFVQKLERRGVSSNAIAAAIDGSQDATDRKHHD
jgi:hypothetical protein